MGEKSGEMMGLAVEIGRIGRVRWGWPCRSGGSGDGVGELTGFGHISLGRAGGVCGHKSELCDGDMDSSACAGWKVVAHGASKPQEPVSAICSGVV